MIDEYRNTKEDSRVSRLPYVKHRMGFILPQKQLMKGS